LLDHRLGDPRADAQGRVECRERILEHRPDPAPDGKTIRNSPARGDRFIAARRSSAVHLGKFRNELNSWGTMVDLKLNGGTTHLASADGGGFMPAFGAAYSDAEIAAVSNYVIAHLGAKAPFITPARVSAVRKLD
jgi:hypothetical protein